MNITVNKEDKNLYISLEGRLDTATAPQLELELKNNFAGCERLSIDFEKLEYISSAGLRVLLAAQKVMNRQGEMVIKKVHDAILEVFEITGFTDILTIE